METEDEPYHKKILSKLTGAVLEEFARSKPSKPLPAQYKNYFTQQLHGFFPILRTPSHPTYAAMINTAISELEDGGGSTEEAISEFIKQKFEDLPWAHASLLSHHLKKLCQRGELISVSENCYMLPNENTDSVVENGDQSQEGQIVIEENQSLKHEAVVSNESGVQGCQMEIDDQTPSQEQLIKQTEVGRQKEIAGQIPTQLEEIAVTAVQESKSEWKNKATEEHRQEELEQGHRIKEPQNEMPQGEKQISLGDIDRTVQSLEEQIEIIDKLTQLQKRQNEASDGRNKPLQKIDSQSDPSVMQELLKKQQKETDTAALDPFAIMVSDGDGLLPRKKRCIELLERTKKIEGGLLEILNLLGVSEVPKQNDSKKQKPQGKCQQRFIRSRIKPDATLSASLPLQNENLNLEKQQQSKKRGRPSKPKPVAATITEELMSFEHQKQQEQPQKKRRGRPPKPKLEGDTTTGNKLILTEQAGVRQSRGRPRKQKLDGDATTGHNLISQNQQSQPNLDAVTTTGDNLI